MINPPQNTGIILPRRPFPICPTFRKAQLYPQSGSFTEHFAANIKMLLGLQ